MTTHRPLAKALNLSLRQLRAVLVLAQERNFTRTASRCHLSQPALSALIRGVEEDINVRLFDRDKHNVRPTVQGELFLSAATIIVNTFDSEIAAFERRIRKSNRFTIAAMPSFATHLLPALTTSFRDHNPDTQIEIIDLFNEPCVQAVRDFRADFGITSLERGDGRVVFEKIVDDPFFVICRRDHPLASFGKVDLAEIPKYSFVHYSIQTRVRHQIDAVMPRLQVVMEIERLETIRALIESGAGISLAPASTLRNFYSDHLVYRPLSTPSISRTVQIVRRDEPLEDPLSNQLITAIKEGVRKFVEDACLEHENVQTEGNPSYLQSSSLPILTHL